MAIEAGASGPMGDIVTRLDALAERDRLSLHDVVDAFGEAGVLPVLIVLALIVISPLSGIPVLPTIFGLAIAIIGAQAALGRTRILLPRWLGDRRVSGPRMRGALARLRGAAAWLDRRARPRLPLLLRPPLDLLPRLAIPLCGAAMPFLELVPFSSSILATAVLSFATAMLTQDGVLVLAGLALMAVASVIPAAVYAGALGLF